MRVRFALTKWWYFSVFGSRTLLGFFTKKEPEFIPVVGPTDGKGWGLDALLTHHLVGLIWNSNPKSPAAYLEARSNETIGQIITYSSPLPSPRVPTVRYPHNNPLALNSCHRDTVSIWSFATCALHNCPHRRVQQKRVR